MWPFGKKGDLPSSQRMLESALFTLEGFQKSFHDGSSTDFQRFIRDFLSRYFHVKHDFSAEELEKALDASNIPIELKQKFMGIFGVITDLLMSGEKLDMLTFMDIVEKQRSAIMELGNIEKRPVVQKEPSSEERAPQKAMPAEIKKSEKPVAKEERAPQKAKPAAKVLIKDDLERQVIDLRRRAQLEKERLIHIKDSIKAAEKELKAVQAKKSDAARLIGRKDKYFEKEYVKIENSKNRLAKERLSLKKMESKALIATIPPVDEVSRKLSQREAELQNKEIELAERERVLEERSNALLELQNQVLEEKSRKEEVDFKRLISALPTAGSKKTAKLRLTPEQVYHMVAEASELIQKKQLIEAKSVFNVITESFGRLKIPKEERISLELSINNLYNDLNLASLNGYR